MNITGTGTVFRNERTTRNGETFYTYSIGIGSKDKDGNYINASMPIGFKRGVELKNKTRIEITSGFLTVREYEYQGQKRKEIGIFVMDFKEGNIPEGFQAIPDNDIPF